MGAPQTLDEAKERYLGRQVIKHFEDPSKGQLKPFKGIIKSIRQARGLANLEGELPFVFVVCYEDEDKEELEWFEIEPLVEAAGQMPQAGPSRRPSNSSMASEQTTSTKPKITKRSTQQFADENDENGAPGPMPHDNSMREEQPRKRAKVQATPASQPILGHRSTNGQASVLLQRTGRPPLAPRPAPAAHVLLQRQLAQQAAEGPTHAESGMLRTARTIGLPGHLKSIQLENFMCHQNFEMDFGTHVTLVSGTNGSGKSAVMQGLQTCLGVTARNTGRAPSLSQFIRTGADYAKVKVTLWNVGEEAYMPEEFGPTITIERRLNRSGGSPYKLVSHQGKTVSTKKDDVDAVLDKFVIDAGNPLTVITQDMARSFLAGGTTEKRKKYEMYMEGTLLENIREGIAQSASFLSDCYERICLTKTEIKSMEVELKSTADLLEKFRDHDRCEELLDHLSCVRAWNVYLKEERKAQEAQADLDGEKTQLVQQLQEQVDALQQELERIKASHSSKEAEVQGAFERAKQDKEEVEACKARVRDAERERKRAQALVATATEEAKKIAGDRATFEEQLNEGASSEKAAQARERLQEFERKLETKRDTLNRLDAEFAARRAEHDAARQEMQKLQERNEHIQQKERQCRTLMGQIQDEKRQLQNASRDRILAFGPPQIAALRDELNRSRNEFEYEPIGPIGMYLALSDARWGKALEGAAGQLLNRYICFSQHDSKKLRRIASSVGMHKIDVWVTKAGVPQHNVTVLPKPGFTSLYQVLRVTDEAKAGPIMNLLVDAAKVEKIVVVEQQSQARDIVFDRLAGPGFSAVDMNGTTFMMRVSTMVRQICRGNRTRVGADVSQQTAQYVHAEREEQARLRVLQEEGAAVRGDMERVDGLVKSLHHQCASIQQHKAITKRELSNLQSERDAAAPDATQGGEEDARIEFATQGIQQCQVMMAQTEVELQAAQRSVEEALAREAELRTACEEAKAKLNSWRGDILAAQEQLQVLVQQQAEANSLLANQQVALAAAQQERDRVAQVLEEARSNLPRFEEAITQCFSRDDFTTSLEVVKQHVMSNADKIGLRRQRVRGGAEEVDPEQLAAALASEGVLGKEATRIERRLADTARHVGGTREELEAKHRKLSVQHGTKERGYNSIKAHYSALQAAYEVRAAAFEHLKTNILGLSVNDFNKYMYRRDHFGSIRVDYTKGELELEVKVKGKTNPNAKWVRDLKQLSGGERSYTTVSFLLAMGQHTESPFRCLDEFDVFMDAINRRMATEALLEFAMTTSEKQYILLTPQDISAVEDAKKQMATRFKGDPVPEGFVKVVCMRPARDNATRAE